MITLRSKYQWFHLEIDPFPRFWIWGISKSFWRLYIHAGPIICSFRRA
jgi:hypothetical protein